MGSKKQTILILNGRRYDALTGEAVSGDETQAAVKPISDMVGSIAPKVAAVTAPRPARAEPLKNLAGPKMMDVSRSTTHAKPRQQQRASTLVRSAVSRPKPGLRSQTKVSSPTTTVATPLTTVAPKWPISQVNPSRMNRAGEIGKSKAIRKFAAGSSLPAEVQDAAVRIQSSASISPASTELPTSSQDLFEKAIAAADSHLQPPVSQKKRGRQARRSAKSVAKVTKKPAHHHLASVTAASFAVLAICGMVALQNKTNLTLRFANAQAGFHASLPTYQPSGYGVGNFNYSAGSVGTTFHNSANNRDYSLVQQTTKWDSQALLDNYVRINNPSYHTLQSGNQIIYVYGKNDASWIKDGIWYQLTSNGSLSTSQVLNIAASV